VSEKRPTQQSISDGKQISRRRIVYGLGAGTTIAVAGCLGEDDQDPAEGPEETDDSDPEAEVSTADIELPADGYAFTDSTISGLGVESNEVAELTAVSGGSWEDIIATPSYLFAVENAGGELYVIDPESGEIVDRLSVGSNPVHGRYIESTDEVWIHSDDEARFYVVNAENPDGVEDRVDVGEVGTGHGKFDVSDDKIVVTNMDAGGLFVIDIDSRETVDHIEFDSHDHDEHGHDDDNHSHSLGQPNLLHDDGHDHDHGDGTHYVVADANSGLAFVESFGGGHDHDHDDHDDDHDHDDHDHEHTHYTDTVDEPSSLTNVTPLHGDDHDHDHGDDAQTVIVDVESGEVTDTLDIGGALHASADNELVSIIDGDEVHFVDSTDPDGELRGTVELSGASPAAVHFGDDVAYTINPHSGDISIVALDGYKERERISLTGDHLSSMPSASSGETIATIGDETAVLLDTETEEHTEFEVDEIQTVGLSASGSLTQ